jgi:hypothetical protein
MLVPDMRPARPNTRADSRWSKKNAAVMNAAVMNAAVMNAAVMNAAVMNAAEPVLFDAGEALGL